jgi:hypothetical protein
MAGKPIATKGMTCPLWRKDVSRVCHTCAWFSHVEGVNPQTGARVDEWMCAITMQVLATLEAAKAATAGSATTQELRNDLHAERKTQTRLLMSRPLGQTDDRQVIAFHDKTQRQLIGDNHDGQRTIRDTEKTEGDRA